MNISHFTPQPVFGCFELDSAGTVLYSKVEADGVFGTRQASVVGQNFFDKVALFDNVEEFRGRFKYFTKNSDSVNKFNFTCQFEKESLPIKVMLIQINEREHSEKTKLFVVDIRKA